MMRTTLTTTALIPLFFVGGLLIGKADLTAAKKAIVDSYLNRYHAASGGNVDEVIYYVFSESRLPLDNIASTNESIRLIEESDYTGLFNVYLSYTDRRAAVNELRAIESVSAVFTVPFFCH